MILFLCFFFTYGNKINENGIKKNFFSAYKAKVVCNFLGKDSIFFPSFRKKFDIFLDKTKKISFNIKLDKFLKNIEAFFFHSLKSIYFSNQIIHKKKLDQYVNFSFGKLRSLLDKRNTRVKNYKKRKSFLTDELICPKDQTIFCPLRFYFFNMKKQMFVSFGFEFLPLTKKEDSKGQPLNCSFVSVSNFPVGKNNFVNFFYKISNKVNGIHNIPDVFAPNRVCDKLIGSSLVLTKYKVLISSYYMTGNSINYEPEVTRKEYESLIHKKENKWLSGYLSSFVYGNVFLKKIFLKFVLSCFCVEKEEYELESFFIFSIVCKFKIFKILFGSFKIHIPLSKESFTPLIFFSTSIKNTDIKKQETVRETSIVL